MVPFSSTAAQVILLIPAYKPAQILPSLVKSVLAMKEHPICGVLIVNDGSGPLYEPIFQELRESGRVEILTHACNLGKGAALKTGLNAALVKWPDAVGVVTADADGQHATTDIITVAQELARFPDALILGVRSFRSGTPFRSLFGNSLTRQVFRLATGKSITDTQTGLRGWPRTACLSALTVPINGYDFELECLLRTTHELREVPIETIYIENNKLSHFNPILDSMKIYFVFLRYCGSAVIAAIVDSAVFYGMNSGGHSPMVAQIAGRAAAVCIAFVVARSIVFRSDGKLISSLIKYLTLVVFMGTISLIVLESLHQRLGLTVLTSKLLAEGLLFLGNFAIQRNFIFAPRVKQ